MDWRYFLVRFGRTGGFILFFTVVTFVFSYYGLFGDNGYLKRESLRAELVTAKAEFAALHAERQRLDLRVAGLRGPELDPDLIDELVRQELGRARQDEVIILLDAKNN